MRTNYHVLLLTTLSAIGAAASASPPATCVAPFTADTRATTATVGSGTAASCTESALASAVAKGGVIRFNCGSAQATIVLSSQIQLRTDVDTTIDGQGKITIDGKASTRLFYFYSPNFQHTGTVFTIQNLTLQNGNGAVYGTAIPVAPAPCSQGTENDGGGGAIFIRDGKLHVWNVVFKDNEGAASGPDVAGGAVYAAGSLGTTIVGSTFLSNHASNGGAVGALWGDLSVYNSVFSSNRATGSGANYVNASCHVNGGQSGNGGNGGAVVMDGAEQYAVNVCGSTFTANAAGGNGALGGAVFRTPDGATQTTTIDRSSFVDNTAPKGGALYFHNSNLVMKASTLSGNIASLGGGGLFADGSTLTFTNDTFANNIAEKSLGGAIVLSGGGTLQNLTFVGNQSNGGSGYFAAAIASSTALTISNTLFSENTTRDCWSPMACVTGSSTGAHDFQWPATHSICSTADRACTSGTVFKNPELGPLQNNGGPTATAAPMAGSPALGAGTNCPSTDQRGIARPLNGCTAGAVEGEEP